MYGTLTKHLWSQTGSSNSKALTLSTKRTVHSIKKISNEGVIVSVDGGVVHVEGLVGVFVGEMFTTLGPNKSLGIVVNLYRDKSLNVVLAALLLDVGNRLRPGTLVSGLGRAASVRLGSSVLGSMLDCCGNFIWTSASRIGARYLWTIESPSPGVVVRESVYEPLQTGIVAIDSLVPIGAGQRELILGDRQTGKTSIGIDSILNQRYEKVVCLKCGIGQRASAIMDLFLCLIKRDACYYASLLVASASSSSVSQYLSAYTSAALSEFFMLVAGIPSCLLVDDLTAHAVAYRELYLLLRRPPGREAYPGEVFYVHSRLLERASKLNAASGGGSSTSFPVVQTLAGDISAYITTNVISITDGQIMLASDLFLLGIKPSIDLGLSVTRIGASALWSGMKLVAGSYKLELSQYMELKAFSHFAADLGPDTKNRIDRGERLVEMLKQPCGSPLCLGRQVGILSLAGTNLIKDLSLETLASVLSVYKSVPLSLLLYVPLRLSILGIINTLCKNLSN